MAYDLLPTRGSAPNTSSPLGRWALLGQSQEMPHRDRVCRLFLEEKATILEEAGWRGGDLYLNG